ncbi:MAG: hypothetical protein AAB808_00445 [Patescibacteria group bacterium]
MKIVLLTIVILLWVVLPILVIIMAGLQNMAKDQRRKARLTTWEGWTLSPAALRNYDKLCMLISMHAYLLQEISRIIQEINLSSDYCGWKRKKLMELSGLAEENARSYNQLSQQTGFRFSLKDWVPDGEERLPRELPFPIQPILDC